ALCGSSCRARERHAIAVRECQERSYRSSIEANHVDEENSAIAQTHANLARRKRLSGASGALSWRTVETSGDEGINHAAYLRDIKGIVRELSRRKVPHNSRTRVLASVRESTACV